MNQVKLQVVWSNEPKKIRLAYKLHNQTEEELLVLNMLAVPQTRPPQKSQEQSYHVVEGDTLFLVKAAMPVALGFRVFQGILPFTSALGPKEILSDQLEVPIPVPFYNPNIPPGNRNPHIMVTDFRPITASRVVFRLGYILSSKVSKKVSYDIDGSQHFAIYFEEALNFQVILESLPASGEFPVEFSKR